MLTMKLDPEKIRAISGIGPKAMETIQTAIQNATFSQPEAELEPEPEAVLEPVTEGVQAEVVAVAEGETMPVEELKPVEESAGVLGIDQVADTVTLDQEREPIDEESVEGRPLEEIFSLRPDMLTPTSIALDEEEETDKKKKKKKKHVKIEYDPDMDMIVATKKHKRDSDDFGDW